MTTEPVPSVPVEIHAADGFVLGGSWTRTDAPRAAVVVHGATATPHRFYRRLASTMAERGYAVLTYDYRGIGASRPRSLRGFDATMTDWAELDAVAAQHWVAAKLPRVPLLGIGHSFGGQVACGLDGVRPLDAAFFMGAQSGYVGAFPPGERARYAAVLRLMVPALTTTFGYWPGWSGIGADLPKGVALEWARWCNHPEYYLEDHPEYARRLRRWKGPLLALTFTDDPLVPRRNAEWLLGLHRAADIEHRRRSPLDVGLPQVGHHGYFRSECTPLWHEIDDFFTAAIDGTWTPMRDPERITAADVAVDLAYGQA